MSKLPVLKRNNEFRRVYAKGRYAVSTSLVMHILPNRSDKTRIGITTGKKIGNSVVRNRMRRLIRENIRLLFAELNQGIDLIVVVRHANPDADLHSIGKEIRYLVKKLEILNKENES